MKVDGPRTYSSPLRAEQAAATRDRIVDATVALLREGDPSAFGMQDVAERAGVSVRTVYRSFPTKDHLVRGVLTAINERLLAAAGSPPTDPDGLVASVGSFVPAIFELEPLYQALFATAAGRESHRATGGERLAAMEAAFADDLAGLSPERARQFVAAMFLVSSSRAIFFLKDYVGLDTDDVVATVEWVATALLASLRDPARRGSPDQPEEMG